MIRYFKRWGYVLAFLLVAGKLAAQESQYYIYIQNEKPQPFYVKYKDKVLSSSDRGYIILSELPAGTTSLVVGFPRNEVPEQPFTVRLGKTDQGFLLKQTDEQHFALYNLQTYSVTKTSTPEKEAPQPAAAPVADNTAPAADNTAPAADTEAVAVTPAPAAPVAETPVPDTTGQAMMAAMRRDLDTALAGKAEISAASKKPVKKQPSKFAEALDKVVSDDRPDDIQLEEPVAAPAAGAATGAAAAVVTDIAPDSKKARRKKNKERAPLTAEEQALLKDVMAQEKQAADSAAIAAAPVTENPAPPAETPAKETPATEAPVTETPAPVAEAPAPVKDSATPATAAEPQPAPDSAVATTASAPEEGTPAPEAPKAKKPKRKKASDPEFIEFDTNGEQPRATTPPATAETAPGEAAGDVAAAATDIVPEKAAKKKKRKLADVVNGEEHPNNIVTDSVDYSTPVRKEKEKESGVKMINSDCQNVMDDPTFRKLLRKFVAAKDDDGMIESFRRNTRGYCLETAQVRRLAQLMTTDESRYKLLDLAYPKAADSENYAGLSELLSDSYYQGRFKAMLHK